MVDLVKNNTLESVGGRIKKLRIKRGWSQQILAKSLGISIPAVSKIESGVTDINLSRLEQIANIYHVNVEQLLSSVEQSAADYPFSFEFLQQKLKEREIEINNLQRKVISLYEQLNEKVKAATI